MGDIVVAHDYLTQRGGAERVALELATRLEARELVTSVYSPELTFDGFRELRVRQSRSHLLQRFAGDMRRALPLLARAWSRMQPVDADAVVCSSSGWAHGVPVTPGTLKVVYCHNPARWLYQRDDYVQGHSPLVRAALSVLSPGLRRWDRRAAASADVYLANSRSVAERIRRAYGTEAEVLPPPVAVDATGAQEPVSGVEPGFVLTVSRPRGYKGADMLVEAFARMSEERLVVVGAEPDQSLPPNVQAVGRVPEEQLRWLYAHARALVSVSREDFGLTPVEANAFGTPVLVLRAGGFLDSTVEGESGLFVEDDAVDTIVAGVRSFPTEWDRAPVLRNADRFSGESFAARIVEVIAEARAGRPG
jgi:glycosyltransferase involved in cell wall biosynthesis